MKNILLLFIFFLSVNQLISQNDTIHWFGAPDVTAGHTDRPIFIRLVNGADPNTVILDMPANPAFPVQTIFIAGGQSNSFDLTPFINMVEAGPSMTISNKGIRVRAVKEMQAFYEIVSNGNNKDIFSLKGKNGLGKDFMIPGQNHWYNDSARYNPDPNSCIEIVATEDNTTITIVPSQDLKGGGLKGVPITITLNKGQVYHIKGKYYTKNKRLAGTTVISNKPIAITVTDDSVRNNAYGGCRDVMGDQIVPIDILGNEYIPVRGFLDGDNNGKDRIFVTAVYDNTSIFINGSGLPVTTLNKGEIANIHLNFADAVHIFVDQPAYVLQVSGFGCEVGWGILPPVECTGSWEVEIFRTSSEDFYLQILVPLGGEGNFNTSMASPLVIQASDFQPVPGTAGQWLYYRKRIRDRLSELPNNGSARISNSTHRFHLSTINGGRKSGCLFGYFSDFVRVKLDPIYHY